ncbi:MAG: acetyl-CoA acetyltransferase [Blastomonas fulva]|uniref:acetyl-CoA acetyltransferase n=1 Tax=Blastomonas fulva TaxID=1550728 RepID=UPI0024E24C4D|nr:acetyl-CoA acetyltransferase [Blastomonas fulva]MDK2758312.1 acetyl-CoA acetyltransferase [Blastomonas fulva]
MVEALRTADADAGGGWLTNLDSLAVVDQISFRDLNPIAQGLADALGASPTHIEQTPIASGDSPILLLNQAANRIGAGEIKIAAIVGGEALKTAAQRAAEKLGTAASAQNASRAASTRKTPNFRQRYGLTAPVDVYPLYENASRAAFRQTLAEGQHESARMWAQLSEMAAKNEGAWIRTSQSIDSIEVPTASNRPIAFPYTKLMVANSSVNQGAGFIVASLAEARRYGIADDRLVYVGNGAAAHECEDPIGRDRYDRSASMEVSIRRTLELNNVEVDGIDLVELYSCFPCVPKMARRILGWPVDRPATVFGGLTFGGGPIGNYMSHAVVSMVQRLREDQRLGLLFANGGFATHNHSIILSREPIKAAIFPRSFDFQADADARRGKPPPVVETYSGPATIESYTVLYERDGSVKHGIIVARTANGSRTLAKVPAEDSQTINFLTSGEVEPIGSLGNVLLSKDEIQIWQSDQF